MNALEALRNRQEKKNISNALSKIYEKLNIYFMQLRSTGDFAEFKKIIENKINEKYTADDMVIEFYPEYLTPNGRDNDLMPVAFTTAYCIEAQRAIEQNGENKKAWECISKSNVYFNADRLEQLIRKKLKKDKTTNEIRSKGGKQRANSFKLTKDEIIRLLKIRCPTAGWKSIPDAARSIKGYVLDFNRKNLINLSEVGLLNQIIIWMRKDHEISPAIQSLLTKNIIKTKSKLQ